eukprot:TRINITY_DN17466_c0_g1_i1.p1 TRINITY_DN17466_c0_g1~~TRINITY_DN17466_c0_g1_i1.p1  ORF type:complete len:423 (-),score=79.51 TRINITY_DN17466_c0_g1_i1:324-1592(-)
MKLCLFVALAASAHAQRSPPWPELASTPPMAWNGWLAATEEPLGNDERLYMTMADALVKEGYLQAGYDTVLVTCNGWLRNSSGQLTWNQTRYPSGIPALAEYLHVRGLKLALYTDTGVLNCCGEPGSFGTEEEDLRSFADWGADHVAVDNCGNGYGTAQSVLEYERFREALVKVGKPMVFGVWNFGAGKEWSWAPRVGHYYRTGPDLGNAWYREHRGGSVMMNYDLQQSIPDIASISGPGSFAFLDQLSIGLPPNVPHAGDPGLTLVEAQTHFALWCMLASPLFLTHDIRNSSLDAVSRIVKNPEVLAVNQDKLGAMAVRIDVGWTPWRQLPNATPPAAPSSETLAKPLSNGDWAVLVFNRQDQPQDLVVHFMDVGNTTVRCFSVRDLVGRNDLGVLKNQIVAPAVPAHGCVLYRLVSSTKC